MLFFLIRSRTQLILRLVIWIANYPDRFGPSGIFVEDSRDKLALKLPVTLSSTVQCYGF